MTSKPRLEKVMIIGLDCADPHLVFDKWIDRLPNLRALTRRGLYGNLTSCMPPITVPAWTCMATSKDPGTLGVYGFRNRADYSYDKLSIATNLDINEPRVWDYLGRAGYSTVALGIPQTFPPRSINGCMVCGFMAPSTESRYTYPENLKEEITGVVGDYMIDVKGFRTDDKQWLLEQIYTMTEKRFTLARHLAQTRPWNLFWMVEMGVDRIHHGFWQYMDTEHHRYQPGNPLEHAIRDYYEYLDGEIGRLVELTDPETTAVWVVSDHGAQRMVGGICFNDWLIREGYLVLKDKPDTPTRFADVEIDWSRTTAWGEGGYYGRCFLNVEGREPHGTIPQDKYEAVVDEITEKLQNMTDHEGKPLHTIVKNPQNTYTKVNGVPPDLIVLFGGLRWRSVGSVGNPDIYTFENDTGPDDANHAQEGMYILADPRLSAVDRRHDATLYDVAPTVLDQFGMPPGQDMLGKAITA